jgi:hypothetical protein
MFRQVLVIEIDLYPMLHTVLFQSLEIVLLFELFRFREQLGVADLLDHLPDSFLYAFDGLF